MKAGLRELIVSFAQGLPAKSWQGSATELLDRLRDRDRDMGRLGRLFPTAVDLGKQLREAKYPLLHQGCEVKLKKTHQGRVIFLRSFKVEKPRQERPPESAGGMSIISERELWAMEEEALARRRVANRKYEETPQPRTRYPWQIRNWKW